VRRLAPSAVLAAAAVAAVLLAAAASADSLRAGGRRLVGRIVEDGDTIRINEFNSTVPGAYGTHTFPKSEVRRIKRTYPLPHVEFQRRIAAARTAEECVAVAKWADEQRRMKDEERWALEKALRLDPDHEAARKELGYRAPDGRWPDQMRLAREFVGAETGVARLAAWRKIERDRDFPFEKVELQRVLRSKGQPTGYQRDRPVTLRADKLLPNAKYTLLVPKSYDPLVPTPLLVGLHGGGAGGADGKLVVGAGHQAMNFYREEGERRGWICACPDALRAGWGQRVNDELVDAMLEELLALYNIDETRIYLTGHSMGGGGTWAQGARLPETWAAIAPTASFGVQGLKRFEKTRTPFYVYHSDDDPRTRVEGVRPQMENLKGQRGLDFVYTELSGQGHGFPAVVRRDIFEFFAPRRLGEGRRFQPAVRPRSSFRRRVSRDEKRYLPELVDPTDADGGLADSLSALLKDLKRGGGVAKASVDRLVACEDQKTNARVARVLVSSRSGPDVRRYAAEVLGRRKAKGELREIGRALLVETDSDALLALLGALEEINDPEAGPAALRFLEKRADYLERRRSGQRLHYSDWATILPTMAHACRLVGRFRPDGGGDAVARTVLEGVLLSDMEVVYDTAVQRPLPPLRALARSACAAAAELGGKDVEEALARIVRRGQGAVEAKLETLRGPVKALSGFPGDRTVLNAARAALRTLEKE